MNQLHFVTAGEISFIPSMRTHRSGLTRRQAVALSTLEAGRPRSGNTREEYERLLIDHLDLIDRISKGLARRHRLDSDEAEDFASVVRMKLVEKDYAILRKFEGRSALKTYLTVVIRRLLLDSCRSHWGKWRPSRTARREGSCALLFERLITRDGLSFDDARAAVEARHPARLTDTTIESLAGNWRRRPRRQFVDLEALANMPAPEVNHNESVLCGESRSIAARSKRVLAAAVRKLEPRDREIIRLRFVQGLSVADVARTLRTDQKALYRRIGRLLASARTELEGAGVSRADVHHSW